MYSRQRQRPERPVSHTTPRGGELGSRGGAGGSASAATCVTFTVRGFGGTWLQARSGPASFLKKGSGLIFGWARPEAAYLRLGPYRSGLSSAGSVPKRLIFAFFPFWEPEAAYLRKNKRLIFETPHPPWMALTVPGARRFHRCVNMAISSSSDPQSNFTLMKPASSSTVFLTARTFV
jgi:hypothetical protein